MPPMRKPYVPKWSDIGPTVKNYALGMTNYKTVLQTVNIGKGLQRVHGDNKSSVDGAVTTWISIGNDTKLHWYLREGEDANKVIMSGVIDPPTTGTEAEKETLASALLKADIKKKFKEATGDNLKFKGE